VKSNKEFIIPFIGLKVGFHDFNFEIHDAFFEEVEYSIIHKGNVTVSLTLEKKETMLIGEFQIGGTVSASCDRCNDPLDVPVKGTFRLVYKFDNETSDDESLIVLHPDAYELDVRDNIYELITVSLPARLTHPMGECNEEMIELLKKYSGQPESVEDDFDDDDDWDDEDWEEEDDDDGDDDPVDPRWSALKNLN
jgi:uncharacterized metal-binding protein YceD (DUF177 family)